MTGCEGEEKEKNPSKISESEGIGMNQGESTTLPVVMGCVDDLFAKLMFQNRVWREGGREGGYFVARVLGMVLG